MNWQTLTELLLTVNSFKNSFKLKVFKEYQINRKIKTRMKVGRIWSIDLCNSLERYVSKIHKSMLDIMIRNYEKHSIRMSETYNK